MQSHPAWVCGLKRIFVAHGEGRLLVTPCVGVWIETFTRDATDGFLRSHPAWVCGLRLEIA